VTRVLIVEDQASYREPLTYQLEREGFEVEAVADGIEALAAFAAHEADIVLLDVMIPGKSGTEVCRELRAVSGVPIIMVTAKGTELDKVVGLELGADDYLTKPYSFRELLARMRAVLRRQERNAVTANSQLSDTRAKSLDNHNVSSKQSAGDIVLDVDSHTVTVKGQPVHLPIKEFDLLEFFMRHDGKVLSRGQLINEIWGSSYVGDTKTLDVHIKRIRNKLEPDPAHPTHLQTVRGLGYKFVSTPPR